MVFIVFIRTNLVRQNQLSLPSLSPATKIRWKILRFSSRFSSPRLTQPLGESNATPRIEREGGRGPTTAYGSFLQSVLRREGRGLRSVGDLDARL